MSRFENTTKQKGKLSFVNFLVGAEDILSQTDKATLIQVSHNEGLWVLHSHIHQRDNGNLSMGIAKEFDYTIIELSDDKAAKAKSSTIDGAALIERLDANFTREPKLPWTPKTSLYKR